MFRGQQIDRNIISSEVVKQYWQRSAYLPVSDTVFADMKSCFSQENRSHERA